MPNGVYRIGREVRSNAILRGSQVVQHAGSSRPWHRANKQLGEVAVSSVFLLRYRSSSPSRVNEARGLEKLPFPGKRSSRFDSRVFGVGWPEVSQALVSFSTFTSAQGKERQECCSLVTEIVYLDFLLHRVNFSVASAASIHPASTLRFLAPSFGIWTGDG